MELGKDLYKENKAIFEQLKADGTLEKNHWYLVKSADDILKSKIKEDLVRVLRSDAVSARSYYLEYNGHKVIHRL